MPQTTATVTANGPTERIRVRPPVEARRPTATTQANAIDFKRIAQALVHPHKSC